MDQETWDNLDFWERFRYLVEMRRQNKHRNVDFLKRVKVLPPEKDSYQKQQKRKPKWAR
jgi:hypothetical protein